MPNREPDLRAGERLGHLSGPPALHAPLPKEAVYFKRKALALFGIPEDLIKSLGGDFMALCEIDYRTARKLNSCGKFSGFGAGIIRF